MSSDIDECFKQFVITVPILRNVLFVVPLRIGNIILGIAGAIFYCVIGICLINKSLHDPFTLSDNIIYGAIIALAFVHSIGCAVFVVGVVKEKHDLVYPWLCTQALLTVDIVLSYLIVIPSAQVVLYLFNWCLLQAYIWLCGYSIYDRLRKQSIPYSLIPPPSLNDKYTNLFAAVGLPENAVLPQSKNKCKSVDIKIHERLK